MDGDQTGQETRVRTFYSYPWTHVLRASPSILTTSKKVKTVNDPAATIALAKGVSGNIVLSQTIHLDAGEGLMPAFLA